MKQNLFTLFLVIGVIFGSLAGLMAFPITYNEYSHHYTGRKRPAILSLRTAIFTFAFMSGLTALLGYVLTNYVLIEH